MTPRFDIVILGLSITSSWGNGHATTYRSLVRGMAKRGRRILFLERDAPWYAGNRDQPRPQGAVTELYRGFEDLVARFESDVSEARLVIVGSFVQEGARVGDWVTSVARGRTAFYDIDTPVTLDQLERGSNEYITPALIRRYHAYLSFTGGPVLRFLESHYGAPMARVLYCSVDTDLYRPRDAAASKWDLGYLGTYSPDRQPVLDSLLLEPARRWLQGRFAVRGAMYPKETVWPENIDYQIHLSPWEHPEFYCAQRFSLNVTRAEMKKTGFSPSVRLFEAGACAVPIISDWWDGIDRLFAVGKEVLIAEGPEDSLRYLHDVSDSQRKAIGESARKRVLAEHTYEHRALQLESYLKEIEDNALPKAQRKGHSGMKFVIFGLSMSSSWGNGHATLWRGMCSAMARRGHRVVFFERDQPWYAAHRDFLEIEGGELILYQNWSDVRELAKRHLSDADVGMVTSYCPDGIAASGLVLDSHAPVRVFYDMDTPVTLARLREGQAVTYLGPRGLRDFDLVLSYTGGRALEELQTRLGATRVAPLYGSVDPSVHRPSAPDLRYRADLSYLGTYAPDRDSALNRLFIEPARRAPDKRFVLGGSKYDGSFPWQPNIFFHDHVACADHPAFYCSSRLTLNVTREPMADMGYCPSGRLFEATACGTAVLSDSWEGLDCFFEPGSEILLAEDSDDTLAALERSPEELQAIARAGRERTVAEHTADVRVLQLEEILDSVSRPLLECAAAEVV